MNVTLKALAAQLDLSPMAVSKALRDAPDIGESTKKKVQNLAHQLGYVPNHLAQTLKGKSSKLIGLLLTEISDPLSPILLEYLSAECQLHGYDLLTAFTHHSLETEKKSVLSWIARNLETVFVLPSISPQHRSPLVQVSRERNLSIIFLDRFPADAQNNPHISLICPDHFKAAEIAIQHLVELGHRNILYLSGPLHSSSASEHFQGFLQGMKFFGIPIKPNILFHTELSETAGYQSTMEALKNKATFTAVLTSHPRLAYGAMTAFEKENIKIPEKISIISYGTQNTHPSYSPQLTLVYTNPKKLAQEAFNLWLENKSSKKHPCRKTTLVELLSGKTTAPCKS